jgi:hypothetical protein
VADLDLFRLGLALDVLPPSPRSVTPLKVAQGLAEFLTEWWQTGGDFVSLAQAFRLLPAETVAGVVLRALAEIQGTDPRYWSLPALDTLLPLLRVAAWQELIGGGSLLLEAVPANASRHRVLSPLDLPWLIPDFSGSRLLHDGRVAYAEARVRRVPVPVERWRKRPSEEEQKEIRIAIENILSTNPGIIGGELETKLYKHFDGKVIRTVLRAAIKGHELAQKTIIRPGRPRKNKQK